MSGESGARKRHGAIRSSASLVGGLAERGKQRPGIAVLGMRRIEAARNRLQRRDRARLRRRNSWISAAVTKVLPISVPLPVMKHAPTCARCGRGSKPRGDRSPHPDAARRK